ncbi:MAG: hypothetical protein HFG41_04145 [Coprococcus sp.]|nr:hypothetical protein [Coprococcus sp.]
MEFLTSIFHIPFIILERFWNSRGILLERPGDIMGGQTKKSPPVRLKLRSTAARRIKFAKPVSKLPVAAKEPLLFCSFGGGLPDSSSLGKEMSAYMQA